VEHAELFRYVNPGESGTVEFETFTVDGVELEFAITLSSTDPEIVSIDENGNWMANGNGKAEFIIQKIGFTEESQKLIKEHNLDVGIHQAWLDFTYPVTVTEDSSVFRLYNPNSGEHFYTLSEEEFLYLEQIGWRNEGIGWLSSADMDVPIYRLYNPNAGDHHYTASAEERDWLVTLGWNDEGISFYAANEGLPVYRQYNPNAIAGAHNFTLSKEENDYLKEAGWHEEGISWYTVEADYLAEMTPDKP
jgi:hypothetical protein